MQSGYEIKNGALVRYQGSDACIVIPDHVTAITRYAFKDCTYLKSVTIPDSVTEISSFAFADCINLSSVSLPSGISEIGTGVFLRCKSLASVIIPDSVTSIGQDAFCDCKSLASVTLPHSIARFGYRAFKGCEKLADRNGFIILNGILCSYEGTDTAITIPDGVSKIENGAVEKNHTLVSVVIPDGVTEIGHSAFCRCGSLTSVTMKGCMTVIDGYAFTDCPNLVSFVIPGSVKSIGEKAFSGCERLSSIMLPVNAEEIGESAFEDCKSLASVSIPDSMTVIRPKAFKNCKSLTSIVIPDSVTEVGWCAFNGCASLRTVVVSKHMTRIERATFAECTSLHSIVIPKSVTEIDESDWSPFGECHGFTVVCEEGSYTHQYCKNSRINFIFDYQYEAYHGLLPPGFEKLASPFLADEEKPYIFISYSHKDRTMVLNIIKTLYEAGWKIWYDEGLTIGDRYDETLEEHVKNCSAFLLFVTENSLASFYCKENEIPWAIQYGKPIIKCIADEGSDYAIEEGSVLATVLPSDIEQAFEKVSGLTKGGRREAKGISVVVNPSDRGEENGNGFAYCLYARRSAATAQAILLEAKNSGCAIYNAVEAGEDDQKMRDAACLIVFLDKTYLSDEKLTRLLIDAYQEQRDIAVCLTEALEDEDLPQELLGLHKQQWLNFVHGITADMNTKLARHLQKRGCRDAAVLPGFEYEETDRGIVLKRYTGLDPDPRIESAYGGIPVVEIADAAFKNCAHLRTVSLPENISRIGKSAFENCVQLQTVTIPGGIKVLEFGVFMGCSKLASVIIPDGVKMIGEWAFKGCASLTSVCIPDSVTKIEKFAFNECTNLASVRFSVNVTEIGDHAFGQCKSLASADIPSGVRKLEWGAFEDCTSLISVLVPGSVTSFGKFVFASCKNLTSVIISDGVQTIGFGAFQDCTSLSSVVIPKSVKTIEERAFLDCLKLTVICPLFSKARKYCKKNGIPFRSNAGK